MPGRATPPPLFEGDWEKQDKTKIVCKGKTGKKTRRGLSESFAPYKRRSRRFCSKDLKEYLSGWTGRIGFAAEKRGFWNFRSKKLEKESVRMSHSEDFYY